MSPVFAKQSDANKLTPTKGQTFRDLIAGSSLEDVGLFNWGTKDKAEINRALVELVGCQTVNDADPLLSELDPARGTGGAVHRPVPWAADAPLDIDKTHTFTLKKRLPMPAVAITELPLWFIPKTGTCSIKYRLEGAAARADKTDLEVHVTRYRDRKGVSQTSYYEIKDVPLKGKGTVVDANNPMEHVEAPCGTEGPDDTHIWREHAAGVAPSEITKSWDGESKATKGTLASTGPGTKYINSSCAPYSVLVRYYKNDDDKAAAILFKESFYPRWKVEAGGTRKLDPASLVVRWTVTQGPKKKLVLGQLRVIAKDGTVACCVGLDEGKLLAGELDLAPLWPETEVKRDQMPYRVQIQAHSGPDEAEGLALAVMPTQVRAYQYARVQYHAFNVRPGSPYMGDADHDIDIAARCDAMIEAVQKSKAQSDASTDILKIFMAPEFYFRGPEGAYPVEKIETIMPLLRAEADKIDYVDWMFVFGSAIGYQKHEDVADFALSGITTTEVTVKPQTPTADGVNLFTGMTIEQGTEWATIDNIVEVVPQEEYRLTFAMGPVFTAGAAKINNAAIVHQSPVHAFTLSAIAPGKMTVKPKTATGNGIIPVVGWRIFQGTEWDEIAHVAEVVPYREYELTFVGGAAFAPGDAQFQVPTLSVVATIPAASTTVTRIHAKGGICSRIPPKTTGGLRWRVAQGAAISLIAAVAPIGGTLDEFWLTLDTPGPFKANNEFVLIEPMATEVTNVCLVQKGYPSPYMGDGNLRHVGIYKEKVSPIDFLKTTADWHKDDASDRQITIHGMTQRPVLPTSGADDLAGASPNVERADPTKTAGSEINVTGIGGGVVYTMDDITFGLEVCLDHAENRLSKFYAGTNVEPGDPKVQIHLIPSWGMSIGLGDICCPPGSTVFNVDGSRCETHARLYDGTWSCDDHPDETGAEGDACTKNRKYYHCSDCGTFVSDSPGKCDFHTTTTLQEYSRCGTPRFYACQSGCWATTAPCAHPTCLPIYKCKSCTLWQCVGETCGCATPKPVEILCDGRYYSGATCPKCAKSNPVCNRMFQELGQILVPTGAAVDVPKSIGPKYFQRGGRVLAYSPQPIPPPDIV